MASSNATVTALKTAFINTQVNQLLSKPLEPSERALRRPKNHDPLPERVVRDVTEKVNRRIREHGRDAWSSIAVRHKAEQIDWLYWNETEGDDAVGDYGASALALHQEDDLSLDKNIEKLPDYIEELQESAEDEVDAEDLSAELARLQDLSAQRLAVRKKLQTYNELISLLRPFEQPQASIQPNLVTRDGALAAELLRLRSLSMRVAGRLSDKAEANSLLPDISLDDVDETMEDAESEAWSNDADEKLIKALATVAPPRQR